MSGSNKSVQMTKHFTSIKLPLHFLNEINKFKYLCWEKSWNPNPGSGIQIRHWNYGFRIPNNSWKTDGFQIRIAIPGNNLTGCLQTLILNKSLPDGPGKSARRGLTLAAEDECPAGWPDTFLLLFFGFGCPPSDSGLCCGGLVVGSGFWFFLRNRTWKIYVTINIKRISKSMNSKAFA